MIYKCANKYTNVYKLKMGVASGSVIIPYFEVDVVA